MTETETPAPEASAPIKTPTLELSQRFQLLYDFLNYELFEGKLPSVVLSFTAGNSWGFFKPKRWQKGEDTTLQAHEISLNPVLFQRKDNKVFETLARLMVNVKQHEYGAPSRRDYCNAQWAGYMEEIGLIPSDTGEPGGQKTGFRVGHYVDPAGKFALALAHLPPGYFEWWTERIATRPKPTRIKYTCPVCGVNAWGGQELKITCHTDNCNAEMQSDEEQTDLKTRKTLLPSQPETLTPELVE